MDYPSSNMQATMTSVYNLGCFVGAMSTIWTGDIFGRPRQVIIGSTVIAVGAVIQTASFSVAQMMVGRVVAGLGTGISPSHRNCPSNALLISFVDWQA
jgi:MFS family permease